MKFLIKNAATPSLAAMSLRAVAPRLDVVVLPLPPTVRHKLQCAGFKTTGDLEGVQPLDLAQGNLSTGWGNKLSL